jgi:MFS family permease
MIDRVLLGIRSYVNHLRFQRNAWLYLSSTVIVATSLGAFGLLFNFYALSLGFSKIQVGSFLMFTSLASLLGAFPAGYLTDRIGRKSALILASVITALSVAGLVAWHTLLGFWVMNILRGMAQSLAGVTLGPFLMENSRAEERTYLFSFNQGIQTIAGSVANWIGGQLPTWIGSTIALAADSPAVYGWSIVATAGASLLGVLPLLLLKSQPTAHQRGEVSLSPFQYTYRHASQLFRFISPGLVISLGAGLLIPFLNIFFKEIHHRSVAEVGALFSWSSLAMGIGLLLAPPLAERYGKMRLVVITQALSVPFLILLGFSPWYWVSAVCFLVRAALMNMNSPVYSTFVMEQAEPEARATVASLMSMSWNLGWTFSPLMSGWLQESYGFTPLFIGTITTYGIAIWMYWWFFLRKSKT